MLKVAAALAAILAVTPATAQTNAPSPAPQKVPSTGPEPADGEANTAAQKPDTTGSDSQAAPSENRKSPTEQETPAQPKP